MVDLLAISWPAASLGPAMEALARSAGLEPGTAQLDPIPEGLQTPELNRKLMDTGARMNLEVDHVYTPFAEVANMLRGASPAILRIEVEGNIRFLALMHCSRKRIKVLTPDLNPLWIPLVEVVNSYCQPLVAPHQAAVNQLLDDTGVPASRRKKAFRALLVQRLGARTINGCWLLRLSPGRPFAKQLAHEGVTRQFGVMFLIFFLQYFAVMYGWWLIGRGALSGVTDLGWLWAWGLMLYTSIPLQVFGTYLQGLLSAGLGSVLKKRLLYGALRLDPEKIRLQGAGQLLSRVLESETIEGAALAGGFGVVMMVVELSIALYLLTQSAAPVVLPLLLLSFMCLAFAICRYHWNARQVWADQRIEMTHELIEKMVGHRTRLAQESRATWHLDEDRALRDYLRSSVGMDDSDTWMNAIVVRGWMVVGILGVAVAFVDGDVSRTGLAIALGGVLLARDGFVNLSGGFGQIMIAAIAWQRVAPLFKAGRETDESATMLLPPSPGEGRPLVETHNLSFHYKRRRDPILTGCNLSIHHGDRLLLQGTSGAGKSTLGSLLTGIRDPDTGLLLYRGLDRESLSARVWSKQVVSAPQFHENHVFTETFMFNLLMGRNWPPLHEDMRLAQQICEELNLGPLLERMPSGMQQMVGETGWKLSHGERSRLFIARTLLQGADVVILDESFAALDPENLKIAMACVEKHAPSLLVIAHP